jgi:hypothetical protein
LTKPIAGLGGGIVGLARLALLAVDRRDVDDPAELALAHAGPDRVVMLNRPVRLVSMTAFH